MRLSTKTPFSPLSTNRPAVSPVTIFPKEILFQDIVSNSCYQIDLFIRNQSTEIQKLRIIEPQSKEFKLKIEEGKTKKLAQGLAWKVEVLFCSQKIKGKTMFEDKLIIAGDSFKQVVPLKARVPQQTVIIPPTFNLGRLLVSHDNIRELSLNNISKRTASIRCQCYNNSVIVPMKEMKIQAQSSLKLEIKLKSKKQGVIRDTLKFSNGAECEIYGAFVDEAIELFGEDGEKLMMLDVGQLFIGQKVEQKIFLMNNTDKQLESILKTFNKSLEMSEVKVDPVRQNFIIRSLPEEYANQLKNSYSQISNQRVKIEAFSQFENMVTVYKEPTTQDIKKFHYYVMGLLQQQIEEQPITETLIVNVLNYKPSFKIPIKFISVFPRLKVNKTVVQFGQIKERSDATQQITFFNDGQRDIQLIVDNPINVKVQGAPIVQGHRSQIFKISLRAIKAGKISEAIKFKIFNGLTIEVKLFATCRSSSIRAKKICNLNSTRDEKNQIKLYETLASCLGDFNKTTGITSQLFNRTDALAENRTNKLKKLMKEHIESEQSPRMRQPQLELVHDYSSGKLFFPKKQMATKVGLHKAGRLTMKDYAKYAKPLSIQQLSNIILKQGELPFGNIFIDTLVTKTITVVNKNTEPILFEIDTDKTDCLKYTTSETVRVEGRSERQFVVNFRPSMLGAVRQPMTYIINRKHIFQIFITAYVTLVNLEVSTKNLQLSFAPYDMNFQKSKQLTLFNKGNSLIKCICKFQDGRHFLTNNQTLEIKPNSNQKIAVTYRPVQSQQEQSDRIDVDKLTVKVVGGAQNIIKCIGLSNDAKITIKEEICCMWHLISVPYYGKLTFRNISKQETLYRIEIPHQLKDILSFEKEVNILLKEQKKQISYTMVSHMPKRISSSIQVHLRGGKSLKVPVQCMFIAPSVQVDKDVLDFGHIPIMGNNYQQIITVTNQHRTQIKLELSKRADCEDYLVQVKEVPKFRTEHEIVEFQSKHKKKTTIFKEKDDIKDKKTSNHNSRIIRLPFNVPTQLEVKFVPRKLKTFDLHFPLKLCGTCDHEVLPIPLKLKCTSIEPMVYLFPQKVMFETRIIGEGKSNFVKTFLIKNPHNFKIDWKIETQQNWKNGSFFLNLTRGSLAAHEETEVQVSFKPQHEGHYWQQLDVVLREKKISHISLQFQGNAIFPSLKFNCNEILLPVVPLKIQSRAFITIENHGFEAITISKWKTTTTFPMVDISVNFVEGRLLSLAKKDLKVEVICSSQQAISFTTMLHFYDEFGTKYQIPLSCTIDNSLMTTYQFLEDEGGSIVYDKKQNSVKILPCQWSAFETNQLSDKDVASGEFIKNWLNHELNLGMKKFPQCFIESDGQLFYRMVTRMANCDLIKRFQGGHENMFQDLYAYYSESIRVLKMEGAFLNQLRPEYLLGYKNYKAFLQNKKQHICSQDAFRVASFQAWTALFYQLCKLFVLPQVSDKLVSKLAPSSLTIQSSTVYSSSQLLIFRFLNSYLTEEPTFNYCDKIKFLQAIQFSLQKNLNIKLTNGLFALKVSMVVMTPQIYIGLVSKFLWQTLSQYGLGMFLNETDLQILGAKQMTLFVVSYINMLYHYSNVTPVSFQASIGDRVTKIIEVENPVARKAKYRIKIQGSEEFKPEQQQITVPAKSKGEIRVVYHCKQNRDEQAKLLLIPFKEDINSASIQPLAFRLTTSIISKITLKKIQISATIYEVTTLCLEAELPIDITELAQFSVSVNDADELRPTFYCFQNLNRMLRNNHDKIDLKVIPLTMGYKYCRVVYKSVLYGEFNFEIAAKIDPPNVVKQIKLKQLKINKEETISLLLPKQNEQYINAQKYLLDHHCKSYQQGTKRTLNPSKYQISIVESSYISVIEQSVQIKKGQLDGKDGLAFDLKCLFGKPFGEYSCTLMIKNELARDIRYYKLIASVAMKPKIIQLELRSKARQIVPFKIPIKIAPCQIIIENAISCFTLSNYHPGLRQNTQLQGIFAPQWMMNHQVILTAQNRQTLEQVIYHINLIGEQPLFFDHVKLTGSTVFTKKVRIPLNLNSSDQMQVMIQSKRIQIEEKAKFSNYRKWVQAIIMPSSQEQTCSIKLVKEGSSQYYWAQITISNDKVQQLKPITLEEPPNGIKSHTVSDLNLHNTHEIYTKADNFFSYSVQKMAMSNSEKNLNFTFTKAATPISQLKLCLEYRPHKQMEYVKTIHILNNNRQYVLEVLCKSPALPSIYLPEVISINMASKTNTINIINSSDSRGIYRARIEPKNVICLDHSEFQLKEKEKKELKMHFTPEFLQLRYKGIIWFESQTFPTYQYHFSAISEFKQEQKTIECEYYSDKNTLKDIHFTNYFQTKQKFTIQTSFGNTPFELVEPSQPHFVLQSGATKKLIVKVGSQSKIDNINGKLTIRYNQKKWIYNMVSLVIKSMGKKINWTCKARQTYYENIEVPSDIVVKGIESSPEIEPFLTYTTEEGTNTLKLKYNPMKPLLRDQYHIFLITDTSKYVINCMVSVSDPPFDDTISIKTKELNQIGCVSFKLTNTKKQSVPFKAYFLKGLPDLSVELEKNTLESYGRIGTTIFVKFTSNVFNKRVEDELWVETSEMVWRFRVVGLLSKKYNTK